MNLYPLLADKIAREPALLADALATARRWRAEGHGPEARLREWERRLTDAQAGPEGLGRLLDLLRDEREPARRLKEFGPFPGLLTREERQAIILACTYDH